MSDNKIWDELLSLKAITETTGVLHDAQRFQLQMWGPLMLKHARKLDVGVTLPWVEEEDGVETFHDERVVEFRIVSVGGPKPKDLTKRMKNLDRWVKRLLGDRFVVRVVSRGKLIFEGKGSVTKHGGSARKPKGNQTSDRH